jgi:hypothetical protein
MDLRGLLGRLGFGAGGQNAGGQYAPFATTPGSAQRHREVTACLCWSQPQAEYHPDRHFGRVLYTTRPDRAHDIEFLGRLLCRLLKLWSGDRPRLPRDTWVLDQLCGPYRRGQRVALEPGYCDCDAVYFHDLAWRTEEVGPDFVAGDLNRSLRTLRLTAAGAVFQPADRGHGTIQARRRLRALRSRGAVPVNAVRVQANHLLYEPGNDDAPGVVLFALSPDADVDRLTALADELFEARDDRREVEPDVADAMWLMRDNINHWMFHRRRRLPPARTGGHEAYVADLWFHRPFLRGGRIVREHGRVIRCLAEPGEFGGIELLPWDAEVGPPVAVEPAWLRWQEGCVLRIARAIAAEGAFDRLPILADALEEAGCTHADMLAHCRQAGAHGGGCWVVDALLGEEETART